MVLAQDALGPGGAAELYAMLHASAISTAQADRQVGDMGGVCADGDELVGETGAMDLQQRFWQVDAGKKLQTFGRAVSRAVPCCGSPPTVHSG